MRGPSFEFLPITGEKKGKGRIKRESRTKISLLLSGTTLNPKLLGKRRNEYGIQQETLDFGRQTKTTLQKFHRASCTETNQRR